MRINLETVKAFFDDPEDFYDVVDYLSNEVLMPMVRRGHRVQGCSPIRRTEEERKEILAGVAAKRLRSLLHCVSQVVRNENLNRKPKHVVLISPGGDEIRLSALETVFGKLKDLPSGWRFEERRAS